MQGHIGCFEEHCDQSQFLKTVAALQQVTSRLPHSAHFQSPIINSSLVVSLPISQWMITVKLSSSGGISSHTMVARSPSAPHSRTPPTPRLEQLAIPPGCGETGSPCYGALAWLRLHLLRLSPSQPCKPICCWWRPLSQGPDGRLFPAFGIQTPHQHTTPQ